MDKMIEKRFEYLKEKSTEELKEELEELISDLLYLKEKSKEKGVNGFEVSELSNSDIPYDEEKIEFIEEELKRRTM